MTHDHNHHHTHHHHHQAPGGQDWAELGAFLDQEAAVMSGFLDQAVDVITRAVTTPPHHIADVGCGQGAAAVALAQAFPGAHVLALDQAPALLELVKARALKHGVHARVTTMPGDLEALGHTLDGKDLIWASMVLHHVEDLPRVLRALHGSLVAGGLLAIAEFGPPTQTLPEDLGVGAAGFFQRQQEAMQGVLKDHLPPGAMELDWPGALRAAGFKVVDQRTILVDLPSPLDPQARQWVAGGLRRSAERVGAVLAADDRATLAILADPDDPRGVMLRNDVEVHAARSLFLARKA
jgi:SAM-dependent methyltransferase